MHTMRAGRGRVIATALLSSLASLTVAAPSGAAVPVSFSCAADAARATIAGGSTINPVTAGGDGRPCQPAIAGLPNTSEAVSLDEPLTAQSAYAIVHPAGDVPYLSTPGAAAAVEQLQLRIGTPVLGVGSARSVMTASCQNGSPVYTPWSEVANITLGDEPLVLDGVVQPITDSLSEALGALVQVRLNEVVDLPGGGKAVRAAHITLVDGGTPLADVIVAEARLATNGNACDPIEGGRPVDPSDARCPEGSEYDGNRDVCVIVRENGTFVVIGRPGAVPTGGKVIPLDEARKRFKSSCLQGSGPRFAVVGTKGSDRITGTNKRDRILGRAGHDRVDSGRRDDCVDGQTGRDRLTGGQGRDKVVGGAARDVVSGDGGTDRLWGNDGDDSLSAGYGQGGMVNAGKGNDRVNIATSGRKTKVLGGSEYDRVWCQAHEVGFLRGVEWVKYTTRAPF